MDSPARGLGRARSPVDKHFEAIYTVKRPYKIHTDVQPVAADVADLVAVVTVVG